MEKNRIRRIQVKNLFDNISYDIDMTKNDSVSIITAPNGRGKTTILNLTSFLFNPRYETFDMIRTIPFDEFKCYLSNGKVVALKQIKNSYEESTADKNRNARTVREQMEIRANTYFKNIDFEFSISGEEKKSITLLFSEALTATVGMDPDEYLDEDDNERYYVRGFHLSVPARLNYVWKMQNQYLNTNECCIFINYIKADRIQPVIVPPRNMREYDEVRHESPLKLASDNIIKIIKKTVEEYNEEVSKAKDKLPQMFLDGEGSEMSSEEFIDGWTVYRNELNQFQEIGLITSTEDFIKDKDITQFYQEKGAFLSTYLSAFKHTTAPLENLYRRLSLFKKIFDERNRITGKKIEFGKQGISLISNGKELSLETLSSGEKHDFIMFYNLIFNIKDHGLVLVDEPEISLHIEWQESYLDILIEICELNDLQAIVATHSPNIVSSHYDLLVDKGEING